MPETSKTWSRSRGPVEARKVKDRNFQQQGRWESDSCCRSYRASACVCVGNQEQARVGVEVCCCKGSRGSRVGLLASLRGTREEARAGRQVQDGSHLKRVEPHCDRRLVAGCCVLVVCGHKTGCCGATGSWAATAGFDASGDRVTMFPQMGCGVPEHGGAESSHRDTTTWTLASTVTTSTKELASTALRTASLFRLRGAHGKAGGLRELAWQ